VTDLTSVVIVPLL